MIVVPWFLANPASAEPIKVMFNSCSNCWDFITKVDSTTLPSGSTNYIQNTSSLQAGATAYPDFIYVGSSMTVLGGGGIRSNYGITASTLNAASFNTTSTSATATGVNGLTVTNLSGSQFLQTDANDKLVSYDLLNATQTWTAPQTISSSMTVMSPTGSSYEFRASTTTIFYHVAISTNGHLSSNGTPPVVSSCGTNPTIIGSDNAGTITVGSGVTLSCTIAFNVPWNTVPTCLMTINTTGVTGGITTLTTAQAVFSFSATVGGGQIFFNCMGRD